MFDFGIADIFSTLCIGIITATLIVYFIFITQKLFRDNRFDNEVFFNWIKTLLSQSYEKSGYAILLLVVVYCLGIIAGDLTERLTDDNQKQGIAGLLDGVNKKIPFFSLPTADSERMSVIFKYSEQDTIPVDLTPLGTSVFSNRDILSEGSKSTGDSIFKKTTPKLQALWLHSLCQNPSERKKMMPQIKTFVREVFYNGKNWCYSKDWEPLDELKAIQSRIDLSRSMAQMIEAAIIVLLVIILINIPLKLIQNRNKKSKNEGDNSKNNQWSGIYTQTQIGAFIVFVILFLIGRQCYVINEANFNKRAFGYYVSDVQSIRFRYQIKADSIDLRPMTSQKKIQQGKNGGKR